MNNLEFLSTNNIPIQTYDDNDLLNEYFGVENQFPISTTINGKVHKIYRSNFYYAFKNEIWRTLSLSQKLQLLKWAQVKMFSNPKDAPKFVFLPDVQGNINYAALAQQGKVLLNLNYLNNSKGLDALTVILHESIHQKDFLSYETLIKKLSKYFDKDYKKLTYDDLMSLPVGEKIYNHKTRRWQKINDKLRQDILLLKNMIISFKNSLDTPSKKRNIYTQTQFFDYLETSMYYISPLEIRAFEKSISLVSKIAEKLGDLSELDKKVLARNIKARLRICGKVKEMKKYYSLNYCEIMNMELINKYNKTTYKNCKYKYVEKSIMQKRTEIINNLWERNLGYYNDHKPLDLSIM